jgi:GNAT superfamily N-acetyltransferase
MAFDPVPGRRAVSASTASGVLIGHAGYAATAPLVAEFAIVVADSWQRRGVGTLLALRLAELARADGIETFEGSALPENVAVRDWARRRFGATISITDGEMVILFSTTPSSATRAA